MLSYRRISPHAPNCKKTETATYGCVCREVAPGTQGVAPVGPGRVGVAGRSDGFGTRLGHHLYRGEHLEQANEQEGYLVVRELWIQASTSAREKEGAQRDE